MKILILDDDPFVLKLLSIQLSGFGLKNRGFLELVPCERGDMAVEMLAAGHEGIGLIFCDLQMPEMDGIEFVRHLVKVGYAGGLVLVSGEDQRILQAAENMARAHCLNVLGALQKPITPQQLRTVLDQALPQATAAESEEPPRYTTEELGRAIDRGELVNHYQPKVDLLTGAVSGMEALVRWRHPEDGMVPPCHFIPLAEDCRLIVDLGMEVLRMALRDARRWHQAGHRLDIAVNMSMGNLMALDFPDVVAAQASDAGVPLSSLVLEITESRLMTDPKAQLDILTRLRLKQVRLSIDDFGTGYSCLAQLRDLPFDELKIDRGFVHRASQDPSPRAILDASLGLARQLGMNAVAEGVEDREDWDFLRDAGCDLAQGYLVARPMPGEHVLGWLAEWQQRRMRFTRDPVARATGVPQ